MMKGKKIFFENFQKKLVKITFNFFCIKIKKKTFKKKKSKVNILTLSYWLIKRILSQTHLQLLQTIITFLLLH